MRGKLAIVSFFYARPYAEGICTKRLVDGLRRAGCTVDVIGSSLGTRERHAEAAYLPSLTLRYADPQRWLGALIGFPMANWDWAIRAGRMRLRPDLVYARYYPLSSLIAGKILARRANVPLAIHFSDPYPTPWREQAARDSRPTAIVRDLLKRAALVTFTTEEARQYMEEMHSCDLGQTSHIVRNVVPDWRVEIPSCDRRDCIVSYVGQFYRPRMPDVLIHGLRLAKRIDRNRTFTLRLVGTHPAMVDYCKQLAAGDFSLTGVSNSDKISEEYARSDISVVMDANYGRPLFLATKAGEAVQAAPRALFITPPGSPARNLFDRGFRSLAFSGHDPQRVAEALLSLANVDRQTVLDELPSRRAMLSGFRAEAVAAALLNRLSAVAAGFERFSSAVTAD